MASYQIPNQTKHSMITCKDVQIPRHHIPGYLDARAYTKCHDKRKSEPATKMSFIQHKQSCVIPNHFIQKMDKWIINLNANRIDM
jgi:hypothetical protein